MFAEISALPHTGDKNYGVGLWVGLDQSLASKGSLSGRVFFLDARDIVSRLDPFFAEAA
jgi:LPXTG-motif cell wall-anchored protein